MSRLHGVFPYLVSPIHDDGTVREPVLTRLCNDLIQKGVHGLTPLGSTGEFAYLNETQRNRIVEVTIEAAGKRVPVVAGVAATTTSDAVAQTKRYQSMGVDGILAILEAYFPIQDDGVETYFRAIADATDLPVVLYTNPSFQRSDLSLAVIERLARHPNITAIKDASSNTGRLLSIRIRTAGQIDLFSASAHIPTAVMLIGGRGWMAGPACLVPEESVTLYELCLNGQWGLAMELQTRLWRLNELFARFNLAACIKAGLQIQGYDVGEPLPPQRTLTAEDREVIKTALDGFK